MTNHKTTSYYCSPNCWQSEGHGSSEVVELERSQYCAVCDERLDDLFTWYAVTA